MVTSGSAMTRSLPKCIDYSSEVLETLEPVHTHWKSKY